MAAVKFKNIRKAFGQSEVLKGIDIDINDGEFAVIVGPSGCGKSTLLRVLSGLEEPTSGELLIGNRLVNHLSPKERNISMVFQSYALYPHMNVSDNIGFGLKIAKVATDVRASKILQVAQLLGLDKMLDRLPRQLSGGQRQRVAMGRAMVRSPDVFLFDEPLSNLDAKLRVQMRMEIRALHQRIGTTSIYVTHDQVEAMTMADRIVVLRDGLVEQVGSPAALYDEPCNLFVAGFIGSPAMNILPVEWQDGRVWLDKKIELISGDGGASRLAKAGHGHWGVRPEHLQIVSAARETSMPFQVEVVEFSGADTLVGGKLGVHSVQVLLRERSQVKHGDSVFLVANGPVHLFAQGGERMFGRG